jgi:hypothetical protein
MALAAPAPAQAAVSGPAVSLALPGTASTGTVQEVRYYHRWHRRHYRRRHRVCRTTWVWRYHHRVPVRRCYWRYY